MKKISYLFVLALLLISSACQKIATKSLIKTKANTHGILFTDVNIFNGKDSALLTNKNVLILNGLIQKISDTQPKINNDVTVINAKGKTLMPGLIDSHVHLSGSGAVPWKNISANEAYNLEAYLYAGITTVYDLGGLAKDISALSKKVENDELIGPLIFNTHIPITIKNSHPIPLTKIMLPWPLKSMINALSHTIDTPEEASHLIEKYLKNDLDYVKISCDQIPPGSPEMSFEQLKALVDEVHTSNKKVFVHIGSPENAINAVKAGADVLAHGPWRGKLTPQQADTIASYNVPIIYTISGFHNVRLINQGKFRPSTLDRHLVDEAILFPVTGERGKDVKVQKVMNAFFEDVEKNGPYWLQNFKLLHERNVTIVVGTDSNLPGTYAGSTYIKELDLLKAYGLSNFEILKGATFSNAALFLKNPDFGTVEEMKIANLLLLDGNPLENIEFVKNPSMILLKGKTIDRIND